MRLVTRSNKKDTQNSVLTEFWVSFLSLVCRFLRFLSRLHGVSLSTYAAKWIQQFLNHLYGVSHEQATLKVRSNFLNHLYGVSLCGFEPAWSGKFLNHLYRVSQDKNEFHTRKYLQCRNYNTFYFFFQAVRQRSKNVCVTLW